MGVATGAVAYTTLIDADELALHLNAEKWVVFDCRHDLVYPKFGREVYLEGHIPGAFFLDVDKDLSGLKSGHNGRHPLPDPFDLAVKLGECGVERDTQIVAYDDAGGMFAARLWWLLRWLGHTRVAVLNGGLQAWGRSACILSTALPAVQQRRYEVVLDTGTAWVGVNEVVANLEIPRFLVVDARSPDRFRGENETLDPVGGHIPGAVNRFFRDNLAPDTCFKSADALQQDFMNLMQGWAPAQVVHQCGSGITACHNLLAMEVAGLSGSRLYPGSWSEWCADAGRPVAQGAA